jgi:hypothetical protein
MFIKGFFEPSFVQVPNSKVINTPLGWGYVLFNNPGA